MITIERVKELAMENYNKGGDAIVECYENKMIQELIESGIDTEEKMLDWFAKQFEEDEELRKAALWYAYGTTDEKEIKKMLDEEETETNDYEEPFNDPCYGCQRFDGSYNCKHCIHGDDGRYESPFDVYTPSELGINVKW